MGSYSLCLRCCLGYNHRRTLGRAHLGPSISQTPKGEPGLPVLQLQSISSRPSLAKELKPSTWGLRSPRPGTVCRAGPSPDPWQLCHCHKRPQESPPHKGILGSRTLGPTAHLPLARRSQAKPIFIIQQGLPTLGSFCLAHP